MGSNLPGSTLRSGYTIYRQPGDGSTSLFHSMSYGLNDGTSGPSLRREICNYIASHPDEIITGNPLKELTKRNSNYDVRSYSGMMSGGDWSCAIVMAIFTKIKNVNLHVYERNMNDGIKRTCAFDQPEPATKKVVRVLYSGEGHYDAIVIGEQERNSTNCCICFDGQANTILQPCRHARFCSRCIEAHMETHNTCPICRVHIDEKQKFFI